MPLHSFTYSTNIYREPKFAKLLDRIWAYRNWNQAGPCGAPQHGSHSVSCFLFVGDRLQPPWPSLSPKGQIQTVANQGKGMKRQGKSSKTKQKTWDQIKGVQALHTPKSYQQRHPWTIYMKLLTGLGHTILRGTSPLCTLLPGKEIKLFSTSPKTLSLRYDSALVHRCQVFDIKMNKTEKVSIFLALMF